GMQKEESGPPSGSQETKVPKDAVDVLWTFGKCLGALLPVYLAGYYRFSTSFLVFGMMIYTGWKHAREAKEARHRSAVELFDNEQEHTSKRVAKSKRDLPAWVNFPDVEKVEWLNKVLQQVWPFVGQYLEKLLQETIAPSIRGSSSHLQTLSFTKVDFGDKPMKVVGIKAHTENDRGQVLLDLYISYVGDVEIDVEVKRYFCKAGVKGIQLHGMMRVILEPLIGDVPIVGAVTMFFIRRPKLVINWTGLTNLLDIPGLNVMSDSMIMDAIAAFLVLPNRLTVPLVPDLHVAELRSPLPRGVVRIHLVEADDLPAKDNFMKGVMSGMSDPYALLRVGPQTFTSKHVDNTVCPKWGEIYEVLVHEVPGQELELEVYDKDTDQDDFLGRAKLDLGIVKKSIVVDDWFSLKDTPSGRVHLRLEWLTLLPSTDRLEQVLKRNETVISKTADPPSAAILVVYLDKAESLPMKKGNKEPNPMVQLSVRDLTRESKICYTTENPQWEEAFTFFIQDPQKQDIDIQVKDGDRVQTLGRLNLPLSRLLSSPSLTLDQWFQLDGSGPASRIYIKTVLRGVLRIGLLAGQNLVPKDNMMGGMVKGKSDPYVKVNVGGETFTSQVVKANLNPTWNEMYQLAGQDLHVEIFDKDMDMKDDFMGRWVLQFNSKQAFQNKAVPSSALLFVYVEQAHGLPVCERTTAPKWNEAFHFLVRDPREDILVVKLSHSWALAMGSLVVPVRELLSEPQLVLDQWFHLDGASPESQVLLRAELKEEEEEDAPPPGPPHTSPDHVFGSEGVLRLHLLEAQSLVAKDNLMGGLRKGKSDPYAKVTVGEHAFKSHVVKENLNPTWNEMYEVRSQRSSSLTGFYSCHSQWHPLEDVKSGRVRLVMEWVPMVSQNTSLDQVLQQRSLQSYQNQTVPTAALLFLYLERGHSLPLKKSGKEPKAAAELVLGQTTHKTKVCARSKSPEWREAFFFPVQEPREEMLIVKLSSAWDQPMGSLVLPVRDLLSEPELVLDQWFPLDGASPESQVLLRAELKEERPVEEERQLAFMKLHPINLYRNGLITCMLHLLEAASLVAKDNLMGGMRKGKSDPYVKVTVGEHAFKSHVVKENLNPTWNEMYEVVLSSQAGQEIHFESYDKDLDADDFLGRFVPRVMLDDVIRQQYIDKVVQLQSGQTFRNQAVPSAALLFVHVERAHALPVCERSSAPQWEESFFFLVRDPEREMLILKVRRDPHRVMSVGCYIRSNVVGLSSTGKDSVDSYVSLMLLPDKNKATKRKTAVKKRDLNPEFNDSFEYGLSLDEAQRRLLSVSVKDNSASFRGRDVIGQAQIELAQVNLLKGVTEWCVAC
uniref:Extended synaptotagmin-like protein 1b n=1 Tax=Gadus morhua TaxID=8049 RepID=A0A8C4Z2S9_GADMO